jgi:DNA repair protein RecO (recombination protein O)
MTLITTEALIIRTIPFQETSSIVKLFTRDQGKIAVIAKGARRLKSQLRGYLEPLCHVEAIYYYKNTRDIQTLSKIDLIHAYLSDAQEINSSLYGLAVLETVDKTIRDHEHDEEVFTATVRTLDTMDRQPHNCQVLFIGFLQIIADILGYRLNTKNCYRCKRPLTTAEYSRGSGQLFCEKCIPQTTPEFRLTEKDLAFLDSRTDNHGADFNPPEHPGRLITILSNYLSDHLDYPLNLKSLLLLSERTK